MLAAIKMIASCNMQGFVVKYDRSLTHVRHEEEGRCHETQRCFKDKDPLVVRENEHLTPRNILLLECTRVLGGVLA